MTVNHGVAGSSPARRASLKPLRVKVEIVSCGNDETVVGSFRTRHKRIRNLGMSIIPKTIKKGASGDLLNWPIRQAVKSSPFHGEVSGSNPGWATIYCEVEQLVA
jgi:hypothetical protein